MYINASGDHLSLPFAAAEMAYVCNLRGRRTWKHASHLHELCLSLLSLLSVGHILYFAVINFSHENIKIEKTNRIKTWVFEKITKMDKLLSELTKKSLISKIRK